MMTDEELASEITNTPLKVIATRLLALENERKRLLALESERKSALNKSFKEIEIDLLKLSEEELRKQFGARVKIMRGLLNLTQADLAEKMEVTPPVVVAYEKGKCKPNFKNLLILSQALNVTTDWLLGNKPSLSAVC